MTKSATGRGNNAKSGLNRAILRIGWGEFERILKYKCDLVVKVDPKHTSTTCRKWGCNNPLNRGGKSNPENRDRNLFKCRNRSSNHAEHADDNAAKNIRKRGLDKMKSHGIDPMQLWNLALPVGKAGNVKPVISHECRPPRVVPLMRRKSIKHGHNGHKIFAKAHTVSNRMLISAIIPTQR